LKRVLLKTLPLGDPDDVAIYAAAAVYDWTQRPDGRQVVEQFGITTDKMYWTNGAMLSYSVTVDIWADVEEETEVLLRLSGLLVDR
jgi:hypothetical protein